MTNEDAIEILQLIRLGKHITNDKALEMAIQALSQGPCDDVVSREKVLEMITDFATLELYIDKHNHVTFEPLEKLIKSLPSVTQKSGHWIKKEDDTCWWYACSECEQEPLKNRWNDDDVLSAYCPNCGAKMESEDKE